MARQVSDSQEISKSMAMRNGFHSKAEMECAIQYPLLYGLQVICFCTENVNALSVRAEDLEEIEVAESLLFWSPTSRYCRFEATDKTRIRMKPSANMAGHYIYRAFDEEESFFHRMKWMDVTSIDLIYDTDYWERLQQAQQYDSSPVRPKKFINMVVPWESYSSLDVDNALQRTWVDKAGYLNMRWRCR